ncbi:sulfite exporter TauE/SafE family protein [Oceanicoccus sp. KOV_DT_Chl]|uniref:sulfite exporter TauE/SafE family protein n=1 Tax=Oceanicoccus sp. KOV_DT_Chl TaxID=1904639 RepID=UPI000C7E3EF9|nr:sulfite exporter TauE/SafE family protein [Oceanicoccus sp. KOV_DT_Chl]
MFTAEINVLIVSAATIAFVHTLMGPDHYLPFVSMGVARRWTVKKMLAVTALCGFGHILGSIALGFLGVALQWQLGSLEWLESVRGDVAAWCLIAFGLVYFAWGIRNAYRNKPHTHVHSHGGEVHVHEHTHHHAHAHVHDQKSKALASSDAAVNKLGPWAIFVIFVLGPCEPLIPLLMYPAAKENTLGLIAVTAVFGVVTMLTMMLAVFVSATGLKKIRIPALERFGHAMAGATIFGCGSSIAFLGL